MMNAAVRPNIIFILIDDLGWADIGCFGSSFYETPNIDALAQRGMRFTDAYASAPVCSPTRASLMSGKSPARVGVTQYIGGHTVGRLCDVPYFWGLPMSERSIASALRDGGYATWHVGKWHLGDGLMMPENHGFERNIAGCGWGHPHDGYFSPYNIPGFADGPAGEYLTDRLTDEAIALIRGRDSRPFFLNFWHYAVHTPIQAPKALVEKYRDKARRLGIDGIDPFERGERFPCAHKRNEFVQRRTLQSDPVYAAMIENLDWNVGRVLKTLAVEGLTDSTLVVFTSDNGGLSTAEGSPTCNAPLSEGKGWMYEGGTRVAHIASWPGHIGAGTECTHPVSSPDWYPTLLEVAELPADPEQHVDGESFAAALNGRAWSRSRPVFWHYPHYSNQGGTPAASVRDGNLKLIQFFEDNRRELYDLDADLSERVDLSAGRPDAVERLSGLLSLWQAEVRARFPAPNRLWARETPADPPSGPDVDPATD